MNEMTTFSFENLQVRALTDGNGEPWLVAMDVSAILGYSDAHKMTQRLDQEDVQNRQISGFGNRGINLINESGLYAAVLGSTKEEAKKFRKWVTGEVLPSIRKTGSYQVSSAPNQMVPQTFGQALQLAADQQLVIEQQKAQLEADKPYTELAKAITGQETMGRRDWIGIMKNEYGLGAKEKQVTKFLMDKNYLYKDQLSGGSRAYAQHADLFKLEMEPLNGKLRPVLKITGKGVLDLTPIVLRHFNEGEED